MARERDAKGRFVKKQKSCEAHNDENDFHHEMLRTYNRLADGGKEYTIEDARRKAVWQQWSLRALALIFVVFLGWLLVSCGVKKEIQYIPVEKKTVETVVLTDTVIDIQLVPYKDSIAVRDTASYLENSYAYSRASWKGGMLYHSLGIFPLKPFRQNLQIPVTIIRDSIPYAVPGPTQYVERELTKIEKIIMGVGLLTIGGGVVYGSFKLKNFIA